MAFPHQTVENILAFFLLTDASCCSLRSKVRIILYFEENVEDGSDEGEVTAELADDRVQRVVQHQQLERGPGNGICKDGSYIVHIFWLSEL